MVSKLAQRLLAGGRPKQSGRQNDKAALSRGNYRRPALRPELILLDLQRKLALVVPGDTPPGYKI